MMWFLLVEKVNNWYSNSLSCHFKFCIHDEVVNEHYPNHVAVALWWNDDSSYYGNLGTYLVTANYDTEKIGTYIVSGADNTHRPYTPEIEQMFRKSIRKETISSWVKDMFDPESSEVRVEAIRIVLTYLSTIKGGK
jgi:hypothetical protein